MIEARGVFPICGGVAIAAFLSLELTFEEMDIILDMALVAGVHCSEEARLLAADRLAFSLIDVTVDAFCLYVGPIEQKAGLFMLEGLLVEGQSIEGTTFVIGMAFDAGLAVHQSVEMRFHVDMSTDFLMAIRTELVRDATGWFVAFQAIFVFEILVTDHERTRGQQLIEKALEIRLSFLRCRGKR